MKKYNKPCPLCGHLNKHLYLEETDGWMYYDRKKEAAMSFAIVFWLNVLPKTKMLLMENGAG